MQDIRTRSPSETVVTAAPISVTVPTASCPGTVPGFVSGTSPLRMWRSLPQIVEVSNAEVSKADHDVGRIDDLRVRDGARLAEEPNLEARLEGEAFVPSALVGTVVHESFHLSLLAEVWFSPATRTGSMTPVEPRSARVTFVRRNIRLGYVEVRIPAVAGPASRAGTTF
jgi:hypothetical protein